MAGINSTINTLFIGPISHVGSAPLLSYSKPRHRHIPKINDHVII